MVVAADLESRDEPENDEKREKYKRFEEEADSQPREIEFRILDTVQGAEYGAQDVCGESSVSGGIILELNLIRIREI
jgi:hypothetical protein